jgi:hypothetical protein
MDKKYIYFDDITQQSTMIKQNTGGAVVMVEVGILK